MFEIRAELVEVNECMNECLDEVKLVISSRTTITELRQIPPNVV